MPDYGAKFLQALSEGIQVRQAIQDRALRQKEFDFQQQQSARRDARDQERFDMERLSFANENATPVQTDGRVALPGLMRRFLNDPVSTVGQVRQTESAAMMTPGEDGAPPVLRPGAGKPTSGQFPQSEMPSLTTYGGPADSSRKFSIRTGDGAVKHFQLLSPEERTQRRLAEIAATSQVQNAGALDLFRQQHGITQEDDFKRAQALAPLRIQEAGAVAEATATGRAKGEAAGRQLTATQTLPKQIAEFFMLDPNEKVTPEERAKHVSEYGRVRRQQEHDQQMAEREFNRILQQQTFQAGENAKGRAATITAAGIRANNQADSRAFDQEDKLRKEFVNQKPVKVYQETKRFADVARQAVQLSAQGNTNAGDQMLVNAMNKLIDPNSVVREGEYARTAQGQSVIGRVQGTIERWTKGGGGLTQPERQQLLQAVESMERAARQNYQPFEDGMRKVAGAYKLSPERIMLDPALPSSGGAAMPTSAPRVGEVQQGYRFKGGDPSQQTSWEKVK